jgi:hypothetical protein
MDLDRRGLSLAGVHSSPRPVESSRVNPDERTSAHRHDSERETRGTCGRWLHLWWFISPKAPAKPSRTAWPAEFPRPAHQRGHRA